MALVQSEGNTPVARELSDISWMTRAISFLSSYSTEGLISSGPAVLSDIKFDRGLTIPFRSMAISGIVGKLHLN